MKANRFRFRAWLTGEKRMESDFRIGENCGPGTSLYDILDVYRNSESCVLMQSTGLTDKRGREIFEGDILRRGNVVPFRCFAVKWGNIENHEYECVDGTGWMFSPDILVECEVVGNVYQNPELLKG